MAGLSIRLYDRLVAPLRRKIQLMISKAVLNSLDNSSPIPVLKAQTSKDEILDNIEYIEPYGFTSHPGKGAEVVVFCVGGNRELPVAVSVGQSGDRRSDLAEGEVAIYHKDGHAVVLRNNGDIEIGGQDFKKLVNEDFKALFDNHVHTIATAGTAAAQAGVSSSPSATAGATPLRVAPVAPIAKPRTFNDDITDAMQTAKTKAE